MRQFTTPADIAPPWWESTWELTKAEIVRPSLGMSFSGGERNRLFLSHGGTEFSTLSGVSGADDADDPLGFAYLDYDRDGWVDMVLASRGRPSLKLFRNNIGRDGSPRRSVAVRFVGGNRTAAPSDEFTARDGYGASVRLEFGTHTIVREHRAGEGWRTQNSPTLLIGIGNEASVDRLVVTWPSGKEQVLADVAEGALVTAYENASESADGSGFDVEGYAVDPITSGDGAPTAANIDGDGSRAPTSFPLDPSPDAEFSMFTSMATWCPACRRELVNLQRLRDTFDASDLAMFGVPVDLEDDASMLAEYERKSAPAYDLLTDLTDPRRAGFTDYVRAALHTEVLPATVIVRRDGTPVYVDPGTPTVSKLRELVSHAEVLTRRERWARRSLAPDDIEALAASRTRTAPARPPWFVGAGLAAVVAIGILVVRSRGRRAARSA